MITYEDAVKLAREVADRPILPRLNVQIRTAEGKESHLSIEGMTVPQATEYAKKLCKIKNWTVLSEPQAQTAQE